MKKINNLPKYKKVKQVKPAFIICSGFYSVIHYWDDTQMMIQGTSKEWQMKYENLTLMNRSLLLDKSYIKKLSFGITLKNGLKLDVPILDKDYKKLTKIKKML